MKHMRYAIVESKFHGGGILWQGRSLRECYRAMRKHSDGCFNGAGCQSYAVSKDGGKTWHSMIVERHHCGRGTGADVIQQSSDGDYCAWTMDGQTIRDSANVTNASAPAL